MKLKHKDLISAMTLEEKASLCSGSDCWHTQAIERLGIPSIMMTDGPHGLRKQEKAHVANVHYSVPATCYPTASALAASWDRSLAEKVGEAIGTEAAAEKVSIVLGPGANIKRSPLCGRNFEYYSEDPMLAGEMAGAFITGLQKNGTSCSLKHYCANNQETARMTVSAEIDERTLNEIYLAPFERAVKKSKPDTLMCSYNKVNGVYSSENPYILTEKLRKEWGFDGIVMSDWGAVNDRAKGVAAGLELEMPSSGGINDKKIVKAVKNGELSESVLDERVDKLLTLILKSVENLKKDAKPYDKKSHHRIAADAAAQCAVLLKNKDSKLPLKKDKKILLVGQMAKKMRYQGSGSSHINPNFITNFVDGFKEVGANFDFVEGYDDDSMKKSLKLTKEAVAAAENYDEIVIVAGLTDKYEAEGYDRTYLDMPMRQNLLIDSLCETGKNVTVLLCCGAPILMPWLDKVQAVLLCYLGGQAAGLAAAELVYGEKTPSGKLAETFPAALSDVPSTANFALNPQFCNYAESVYVGYRFNVSSGVKPLFPFGFGLSYTKFEYSDLKTELADDALKVSFSVQNVGDRGGAEIAQVYVKDCAPAVFRPEYELRGFEKLYLEKGEKKRAEIRIPLCDLGYYDAEIHAFAKAEGKYEIFVGGSSENLPLKTEIVIGEEKTPRVPDANWYCNPSLNEIPDADFEALLGRKMKKDYVTTPKGQYTRSSTFYDMSRTSALARFIVKTAGFGIRKGMHCKKDDSAYKMIFETFKSTPLINVTFTTQGAISENRVNAIIFMLNGHKLRGFYRFVFNRPEKRVKTK